MPQAVRDICQRLIDSGGGDLPMLPTVAREVLALCQSSGTDAAKLSEVLHRDPSLAAHVLKVANSPLYQGTVPIASLQQAVSRLGIRMLCDIAIAAAVQGKLFNRPEAQDVMKALWRHSLAVGCFGKEIARTRRRNVESSFLCGLLHDVGKPVVLTSLLDQRDSLGIELTHDVLYAAMDEYHAEVGMALAQLWQMPLSVEESIRFHHDDWEAAPTCAEAAMTTCLADHIAHLAMPMKWRIEEEEVVRQLPVLEALNLYPDEFEGLLAQAPAVLEQLEAIG